ncbi:MAG: ketosteroid isomerase-like protein [Pseudoalteromonas tetraodonis]|jgi:ketosteroid isomerase-like protein
MPTHQMLTTILESGTDATRDSVQMLYASWLDAIRTRQSSRLVALYAEDAILRGDFATQMQIGCGRGAIQSRFDSVLYGANVGIKPLGTHFCEISSDLVIVTGSYQIALGGRHANDPVTSTCTNFTFVFRKERSGKWYIIEHHSSTQ